jgi:hypothetical protein
LTFFDDAGRKVRSVSQVPVTPSTSWQRVAVGAVAPPGAASVVFKVLIHPDGAAGTYRIDDLAPSTNGWTWPADAAPDIAYDPAFGVEQWRPLVDFVFGLWALESEKCEAGDSGRCIGSQVDNALTIMACESGGDPAAVNPSSGTTGLFQHRPGFWDARTERVRNRFPTFSTDADAFDPFANVMVAALLVDESRDALLGYNSLSGPWDDGPEPWGHWDGSSRHCADPPLVSP